ncbi:MAG: sensor histidine kinase [Reichenbachiella sp.]|uniref:sensor histidine kinase n=1 Tax=Reichenbachiella sp. TaxID=2184521 RepID=UPI003263C44A
MSGKHTHVRALACIIIYALVLIPTKNVYAEEIDLRSVQFTEGDIVTLNKGWVLHWNQLLTPQQVVQHTGGIEMPDGLVAWNNLRLDGSSLPAHGVATYSLRLVLPDENQSLSIGVPKINSAARLWVDDVIVFEAGRVGNVSDQTLHRRIKAFVPISRQRDTIQLTLQVSNFYHRQGGMTAAPTIGATRKYWIGHQNKVISDMVLIGCLFFIGVSMLVLYYAYWRSDKAILYLALFSLCWGYRNLSDEYAPLAYLFSEFPWVWLVKIEYMSLFFGSMIGLQYLQVIFKRSFPPIFSKIIYWVFIPFVALALLLPGSVISYLLLPFFGAVSLMVVYVVIVLVTAKKQRVQSLLGLLGIFSGIAVITYHMFAYNIWGEANHTIVSVGYLIALMINALLLGKRFSVTYSYKDKMQRDVELQNVEISEQASLLNKTKNLLEEQVALRTKELEKVVLDLKERNNHLEQFNYIVSHNMRAPVSNIIGLTNIYNLKDVNDPFNNITIGKIKESVHALDDVLKDLTSVLEVKQKLNQPNEEVDFGVLLEKIQKSIHEQIQKSRISIELDLQVQSIISNGAYWYSIFINLISNAIKYSRHDVESYIRITTVSDNEDHVRVEVHDNGLGIDLTKNEEDVFGLYKRFHHHIEGKGMGLFMVRTQIESMGGHISIESTPGKGTSFVIIV